MAIHATALVDPATELGVGVEVGAFSIIEGGVRVGDGTRVGSHCVIKRGVTLGANCTLDVSVDVANTGERPGKEVVQLYVRDPEASVERPFQELKGFEKGEIAPGETRTVTFTLSADDLSFFDSEANRWRAEAGTFEVMVGGSSAKGLTARFEYTA